MRNAYEQAVLALGTLTMGMTTKTIGPVERTELMAEAARLFAEVAKEADLEMLYKFLIVVNSDYIQFNRAFKEDEKEHKTSFDLRWLEPR